MSIGVLGPVTFEVSDQKVRTWQDARRARSSRWAKHDVHSGKPVKEFLGPDLDTCNLSVRFDINMGVTPKDEIKTLRDKQASGEVLQFTVGGELIGDFTIHNVDEEWRRLSRTGELVVAVVSLSLEEYA